VDPQAPLVDPDLARDVLRAALARGGTFAELFVEERRTLGARLDDGRIEEIDTGLDRGAGVRVVQGESAGYAYSNRLDRGALLEAADAASASVRESPPAGGIDLRRREPDVRHQAERPAGTIPAATKIEWLREADEAARSVDPSVRQVVAGYSDSVQRVTIAASDGRLVVEALDLHGPEVSASGSGELRLTDPFEESDLVLRLALAPQADAPPLLRLLLATPTGVGSRLLMVAGTLAHPQVQLQ